MWLALMNQYSQFIKTVHQKEAKRNATRSLARAAGVDPSALYKGSSTSIHVADVKEDGKWVTLKVKVVQIWDNTSDKITQTGLIGAETGIIKFTIWESANLPRWKKANPTRSRAQWPTFTTKSSRISSQVRDWTRDALNATESLFYSKSHL